MKARPLQQVRRISEPASLTGEQVFEGSWFSSLSWLLLAGVGLSSVLLPGNEDEEDEEAGPAGLFKLLFIPADNRHKTETLRYFLRLLNLYRPSPT